MGLAYTCTSLASIFSPGAVPNLKNSYDLGTIPEKITRGLLPLLLPIPQTGSSGGYNTLTQMGNAPQHTFQILHLLLYAETANLKLRQAEPGLIAMLDDYIQAAATTKFISVSPNVQAVINFVPTITHGRYADTEYHVIEFLHRYTVYL
jgi:hypothetical protein